jgi:hypothetical protein
VSEEVTFKELDDRIQSSEDRIIERIDAMDKSTHERIDKMDTRINGRIRKLEDWKNSTVAVKDFVTGKVRSPYLVQIFAVALGVIALYLGASAKQDATAAQQSTGQAATAAITACQATQDVRNRLLTGLVRALSEGKMTQRYYDVAVSQLPPKVDCSNL